MRIMINIFFIMLTFLNSCAFLTTVSHPKKYPVTESGMVVKDGNIYHNDNLFAEVFYFGSLSRNQHRGLAIYYHQYKKIIWIYPQGGGLLDQSDVEYNTLRDLKILSQKYKDDHIGFLKLLLGNRYPGDEAFKFNWCYDVKISDDGKYIYYKTRGMFFDSSHKYLVEYGVSK